MQRKTVYIFIFRKPSACFALMSTHCRGLRHSLRLQYQGYVYSRITHSCLQNSSDLPLPLHGCHLTPTLSFPTEPRPGYGYNRLPKRMVKTAREQASRVSVATQQYLWTCEPIIMAITRREILYPIHRDYAHSRQKPMTLYPSRLHFCRPCSKLNRSFLLQCGALQA